LSNILVAVILQHIPKCDNIKDFVCSACISFEIDNSTSGTDFQAFYDLGCVHTNRVESSPIQSSQIHEDSAETLWLAYNDSRGSAYTPAESSRVESHESCRVKSRDAACFIFVSQTLVIGRDGRNGCREVCSISERPGGNLRRLAL
jgi:hypothetical protein